MINKALIDRGARLHRLMQNEDFAVLSHEWDERIRALKDERDTWDETPDRPASALTRITHRLRALEDLRSWIQDEIYEGGKEKMKAEAQEVISA